MSEMAYNSWRFNLCNNLYGAMCVSMINRDCEKIDYDGPNSSVWISSRFTFIPDPVYCQPPEFVIVKNKLINRDQNVEGLLHYPCRKPKQ